MKQEEETGQIISIQGIVTEVKFYNADLCAGEILVLKKEPKTKIEVINSPRKNIFQCLVLN